jgi:hypothetical protein
VEVSWRRFGPYMRRNVQVSCDHPEANGCSWTPWCGGYMTRRRDDRNGPILRKGCSHEGWKDAPTQGQFGHCRRVCLTSFYNSLIWAAGAPWSRHRYALLPF